MSTKKIAVMQPYFLPYIGYFQLINAVDTFVIYDDVNFIKKGWINRNNFLVNGEKNLITLPVLKISQNKCINEHLVDVNPKWKENLLKTIHFNYSKAPFYKEVLDLIQTILNETDAELNLFLTNSILKINDYLNIQTEVIKSSVIYNNKGLNRQDRLIDICKQEKANHYINSLGGMELYSKEDFGKEGITLDFIKTNPITYKQFNNTFEPNLSIIDVLMFNSKEEVSEMLTKYDLI